MTYPTDLNPEEQKWARARLRDLAEGFVADGALRTRQWREVFERTWRHPYVPCYYPELGERCVLSIDPQRRGEWLAAVYSNTTLITKVVHVPLDRVFRPGAYPVYTSSSTLPSLLLTMLEALEVTDGCRVLEIGTGSGYNAALLCERLGSAQVTSLDIDPELVELARERLAANGYAPSLAAVDGAGGYPPGAPYDRILATCSVPAIPPAWIEQTAPGGMIMTDVRGTIGGTVVRLTVDADGAAAGRFLPSWASFMALRHTAQPPATQQPIWYDDDPVESVTEVDPALLQSDWLVGCVVQWQLPDVTLSGGTEAGEAGISLAASDGSRVSARGTRTNHGYPVTQYGPRRLWERVEEAYSFWQDAGRPNFDRFGITATPTEQYVWYDHPGSDHRWPLPVPTEATPSPPVGSLTRRDRPEPTAE